MQELQAEFNHLNQQLEKITIKEESIKNEKKSTHPSEHQQTEEDNTDLDGDDSQQKGGNNLFNLIDEHDQDKIELIQTQYQTMIMTK